MSRLTAWWDRRSRPARIELYTRSTFHFLAANELFLLGASGARVDAPVGLRIGLLVLVIAHAVLCAVLSSRAMDWALGRRDRPVRLLAAVAALSAGGDIAVLAMRAAGAFAKGADSATLVVVLSSFGLGALGLGIRCTRRTAYSVVGTAAGTGAAAALLGLHGTEVTGIAVGILVAGMVLVLTGGCSAWLLITVWELDAARELQSQLAVAEERLRFGRDMHDVMGRNLAVIALKSELAVQLARRGRPEAVEQMIEVQRIAQESQREIRDIVRGYRRADLSAELSGALSVLRAAGVDGQADGDDGSTLPPGVQAALGWVIREATTNVLRHSEARRCTIRLSVGASVILAVENDGVPEPAGGAADGSSNSIGSSGSNSSGGSGGSGGTGLAGLRERLAALDGTLATESRAGVFRLTAGVPVPRHAGAAADSVVPVDPRKGGATV